MKKTKKTPKILSLSKETIALLTGVPTGAQAIVIHDGPYPESAMEACQVTTVN